MTSLDDDSQVWARQVTRSRGKNTRQIPDAAHLEQAMGDMQFDESYEGAGTITMTVADPGWLLVDSGFFDADEDGKLDLIEVNYPEGSDDWWRLTQVGLSGSGGPRLELTFMARGACYAMSRKGPEQASRGEMTRAEFLASLFTGSRKGGTERGKKGIQAGGGLNFWSEELTKKQPITAVQQDKEDKDRRQQKRGGIPLDDELEIAFFAGTKHVMSRDEKQNAQKVLDAATAISSDERALLALLCACIVEGPVFRNSAIVTDHDSVGILQARALHGSRDWRMNIANVVSKFMREGFWIHGGAVKLSKDNPGWSPGRIAYMVQGSAAEYADRYDKCLESAKKVLAAYGGAGSGGSGDSYRTAYTFQIGDENDPNESYWDGAIRLAEEVNWRLFIAGKDVYFDSDMTLIRQKPVAVINRNDPAVVSWSGEWDVRNIATECELTLVCDPLEFRAGEVFKLKDFGPLSSASVAKRAGHWIIAQARRGRYDIATTFTLRQPEPPKPEPAPEMAQRGGSGEDAAGEGVAGVYAMAERLSERAGAYEYGGGHGKAPKDIKVTDQLDCSSSTCKALSGGGMWPEDKAVAASGEIASSWGEPGEGEKMTVWAHAGHVFIEFKGMDRARLDTGGGPPSGPRLRASPRSTAGFTPRRWPGT